LTPHEEWINKALKVTPNWNLLISKISMPFDAHMPKYIGKHKRVFSKTL